MLRAIVLGVTALALVLPGSATAAEGTFNGSVLGNLTMPLFDPAGYPATNFGVGTYDFSLTDNQGDHSFHIEGPYDAYGYLGQFVNFSTAGPDFSNIAFRSTTPVVFPNVPLADGRYWWYCDKHGNQMWGMMSIGNYLEASIENGIGKVTSNPSGVFCPGSCGIGIAPGGPEVTLTATPNPGWEFDHWEGACTGPGPCTVAVSGYMQAKAYFKRIPAPPAETASAQVTGVKTTSVRGKRTVAVTFNATATTTVSAQLKRNGKVLASVNGTIAAGTRTLKIKVPKSAKAGAATLRVTLKKVGSTKSFVVTKTLRLPKI